MIAPLRKPRGSGESTVPSPLACFNATTHCCKCSILKIGDCPLMIKPPSTARRAASAISRFVDYRDLATSKTHSESIFSSVLTKAQRLSNWSRASLLSETASDLSIGRRSTLLVGGVAGATGRKTSPKSVATHATVLGPFRHIAVVALRCDRGFTAFANQSERSFNFGIYPSTCLPSLCALLIFATHLEQKLHQRIPEPPLLYQVQTLIIGKPDT
jgi:hypothetical protein